MSATIETAPARLTKTDLQAFKQADRVAFHWRDGQGSIVCAKRVKNAGPWNDQESRHTISVSDTMFFGCPHGKPNSCFALEHNACGETFQTIAGFLREGDELVLLWFADGERNDYLRRSRCDQSPNNSGMELHADSLTLRIKRKDKRYAFRIAVSICPDNSARMIRF